MKQLVCLVPALVLLAACSAQGSVSGGPDTDVLMADAPAPKLADYGFFEDAGRRPIRPMMCSTFPSAAR